MKRGINPDQIYSSLYLCRSEILEHLWLVVGFVLSWLLTTVATWTSWASVIAAWASVVTTWTAAVVTALLTAWASVASAWLALRLNIALWLLDESLA